MRPSLIRLHSRWRMKFGTRTMTAVVVDIVPGGPRFPVRYWIDMEKTGRRRYVTNAEAFMAPCCPQCKTGAGKEIEPEDGMAWFRCDRCDHAFPVGVVTK